MPNYDYHCKSCEIIEIEFRSYINRDEPGECPLCLGETERVYATAPQVRTAKTSESFVDGLRKSEKGHTDMMRAVELEVEKVNHRPGSRRRVEIEMEIQARTSLDRRGHKMNLTKKSEDKKND